MNAWSGKVIETNRDKSLRCIFGEGGEGPAAKALMDAPFNPSTGAVQNAAWWRVCCVPAAAWARQASNEASAKNAEEDGIRPEGPEQGLAGGGPLKNPQDVDRAWSALCDSLSLCQDLVCADLAGFAFFTYQLDLACHPYFTSSQLFQKSVDLR